MTRLVVRLATLALLIALVPQSYADTPSIVINEIMYGPLTGSAYQDQYIELYNTTANTVLLFDPANPTSTWEMSGIYFCFPQMSQVAAHSYTLLVGTSSATFRAAYNIPTSVPILGPWNTGLVPEDTVTLSRPLPPDHGYVGYDIVDTVTFSDQSPWPSANGNGLSLSRLSPDLPADDPASWVAASPTPGLMNVPEPGSISLVVAGAFALLAHAWRRRKAA
ncbi:MAG: lamin tail domain-containing protein [Thermoguttaceae bacterium]|jgi:hypothetical protein